MRFRDIVKLSRINTKEYKHRLRHNRNIKLP